MTQTFEIPSLQTSEKKSSAILTVFLWWATWPNAQKCENHFAFIALYYLHVRGAYVLYYVHERGASSSFSLPMPLDLIYHQVGKFQLRCFPTWDCEVSKSYLIVTTSFEFSTRYKRTGARVPKHLSRPAYEFDIAKGSQRALTSGPTSCRRRAGISSQLRLFYVILMSIVRCLCHWEERTAFHFSTVSMWVSQKWWCSIHWLPCFHFA